MKSLILIICSIVLFSCASKPTCKKSSFPISKGVKVVEAGNSVPARSNAKVKAYGGISHGQVVRVSGEWVSSKEKGKAYWSDNMATNLAYITSVNGKKCKIQVQIRGGSIPKNKTGNFEMFGYFSQVVSPFGLVDGLKSHRMRQGHSYGYDLLFITIEKTDVDEKYLRKLFR